MRTIEEQNIEAVAGMIADRRRVGEWEYDAIEAQNRQGWCFDVRYDEREYLSSTDYTRVSGCVLSEPALVRAMELAGEWEELAR